MKPWYPEDWQFTVTVLRVGKENSPRECRQGLEPGDTFQCEYGCPADLCQPALLKLFPVFEALRSGGDMRNMGSALPAEVDVVCPDGAVWFRVQGKKRSS